MHRSFCWPVTALLVVASFAATTKALANWPATGLPVCDAPYDQIQVVGCEDGQGGMLLAWKDQRVIDYGIYVQRVGATGRTLWADDGVRVSTPFHSCWNPAIASDGAGGAWIVWEDRENPEVDLMMQHVAASGLVDWAPPGGASIRSGTSFFSPRRPACAPDGAAGVIVAFTEEVSGGGDQVVAQRFDANGTEQWTAPAVVVGSSIQNGGQIDVDTHHPLGTGVLLGWVTAGNHGTMQWVDEDGAVRWNGASGYDVGIVPTESRVKVARRERVTGGAYLLHQGVTSIGANVHYYWRVTGIEDNQYVRVVESMGSSRDTGHDANIDRAFDGGFVVGWYEFEAATSEIHVWGAMYDDGGGLEWQQYLGHGAAVLTGAAPAVLYTNTYFGHRFVWPMQHDGAPALWFRTMGRDPGFAIPDPGAGLLAGTSASMTPLLIPHAALSDKVFVAWRDERRVTETDVYANLFNASGMIPRANLQVRSCVAEPNPQEVGEAAHFRTVIVNQSSLECDTFDVGFWRDATSPSGVPDREITVLGGIAPLDSTVIDFDELLSPTIPTTWTSWIVADVNDDVDEGTHEDDNERALELAWASRANLEITSFAVDDATPPAEGEVTYSVTVLNSGHENPGPFGVHLYFDRTTAPGPGADGDHVFAVPGLDVGAHVDLQVAVPNDVAEVWASYAYVDADDDVPEWYEDDNVAGPRTITWSMPENPGWPVAAGTGVLGSPVIASLPTVPRGLRAVVVTSSDGYVHAWDGQGDVLAGWPYDAGSPVTSNAAVGDLDADGTPEVVFGAQDGSVRCVRADGTLDWSTAVGAPVVATPVLFDLDGGSSGALEIVVGTSDGKVHVLDADGSPVMGWPLTAGTSITASPAVGCFVAGSDPVIVIVADEKSGGSTVHLLRRDGSSVGGRWPLAVPARIVGSPALGDVLGDDTLEVCAADLDGHLIAWSASGPGPDLVVDLGAPVAHSIALARFGRDDTKLTLFALTDVSVSDPPFGSHWMSMLWAVDGSGAAHSGWPVPIVDRTHDCRAGDGPIVWNEGKDLLVAAGSERGKAFVFGQDGLPLVGSAMTTTGAIGGALAVSDIDGDRHFEVVLAGQGVVHCYDMLSDSYRPESMQWAQFGHDAERTHCYGVNVVTSAPDSAPTDIARTRWLAPRPNPFNPRVTLPFVVARPGVIRVRVYDVAGRYVADVARGHRVSGPHEVTWDGRDSSGDRVASGVYLVQLRGHGVRDQVRVVLVE